MKLPDRRRAAALIATAPLAVRSFAAEPGEVVRWPEVKLLDGRSWSAAQAQDKAVVAVFWSVTCPFCRRHNPHVEKLRAAAVGKPLELVTIARDRDPTAVTDYLNKHGWKFAVTLDYAPMAAALSKRNVIPLTITVDRNGRLKQVIAGEMFEEDVLELLQLAG